MMGECSCLKSSRRLPRQLKTCKRDEICLKKTVETYCANTWNGILGIATKRRGGTTNFSGECG